MKSTRLLLPTLGACLLSLIASAPVTATPTAPSTQPAVHTFVIGQDDFLLDGRRFQIRCGELHAARVPREYWRHRLQMIKAMGLNTVCAYLFWNRHEPRPGEFNFTGQADAAEFCRVAQEVGLWVILRPGPYACAEWEMGGFPWWLLKHDDIQLRTRDPRYVSAVRTYLARVGRELAPLQVDRGGPILMVQVENEYGFFGNDAAYMGEMRQAVLDAGFTVPLFACNPTQQLRNGFREDLFPVVNFGSDPAAAFQKLREVLPRGPLMCGEFYPGWFDTWGAPHHLGNTEKYLGDLTYMLEAGASFSIYMAHGGTTFGLWAGADRPFKPDTSTYDYDAPISEAGWVTPKFELTRALLAKHLLPGETIPAAPAANPVITFPAVTATACAPLFANLPAPLTDDTPRTMEAYDQGYGCILYRTTLPAGPAATLSAKAAHDFGFVFVDGVRVGVLDRRNGNFNLPIPARTKPAVLDILVEPMGRVNFGAEVHDRKGLHGPVQLTVDGNPGAELTGWEIFRLPLDGAMLAGLRYAATPATGPAFWRASVALATTGDTFLDLHGWGKGVVWVNGHCLGRYWNIGPAQTLYVPGPWLKVGVNEIVVLDHVGPREPVLAGLAQPVLDELRPRLDFTKNLRPVMTLALAPEKQVHTGTFPAGAAMQEVRFAAPRRGRQFCFEARSALNGGPAATLAEIDLLDAAGKVISHEGWTVAHVDSEERTAEDGVAENAIDGQIVNAWQTEYHDAQPGFPHRLVLSLGQPREVAGFRYTPRQGAGDVPGRIKEYAVYVGDDLATRQP